MSTSNITRAKWPENEAGQPIGATPRRWRRIRTAARGLSAAILDPDPTASIHEPGISRASVKIDPNLSIKYFACVR